MAADKSKSLVMAQRLKELRTEKGLSHESLRKALMEKYEIDISVDSLKNYEVSKVPHAKAYKNEGMRVEYLRCLADFYGVSADYLLGADVPRSADFTIKQVVEFSGLTEENAIMLHCASTILNNADGGNLLQAEQQLMSAFEFLQGGPCPRQVAWMFTGLINYLTAAVLNNEGIMIDFATLVSTSEVSGDTPDFYDHKLHSQLLRNGLVAMPATEYIRYISSEIGRSLGDFLASECGYGKC